MRLTAYTDYALRMLMLLGLRGDRLATIDEVARRYGISKNHLMKVAHQLGRAGYVETVRGRKGGLRLARPADEIVIGEVVRRTEEDFALVACFECGGRCVIAPECKLRLALHHALQAFLAVLDRHTLADLLEPRDALGGLLNLEPEITA